MFFRGSRYANVAEHEFVVDGRAIRYKRIRFIPETNAFTIHTVGQGERLDVIAYAYYQDPEVAWRICDANEAMWPDDLTADPGASLRVPAAKD
ncbi:hypothetical protein ACFLTM_02105 [Candidatus Bipolaricaulota bacterium]